MLIMEVCELACAPRVIRLNPIPRIYNLQFSLTLLPPLIRSLLQRNVHTFMQLTDRILIKGEWNLFYAFFRCLRQKPEFLQVCTERA